MNLVGVPKTIDNDVPFTENAIGYLTAVDVATEALDRLQPTAMSHSRVMVLEVMGRDAGHIALSAGIAGGADVILIPEITYSMHHIRTKIEGVKREQNRNFALVVVAEGAKLGDAPKTREDESVVNPPMRCRFCRRFRSSSDTCRRMPSND